MPMPARPLTLAPTLALLLASCTDGSTPTTTSQSDRAADASVSARPDPWARAPAAEGKCRWAGLRFSVDDFVPAPDDYTTSDGRYCMNYSGCNWLVEQPAGMSQPVITERTGRAEPSPPFELPQTREFAGTRTQLRVKDGWLMGFNQGEFGGSLWWFSPDGQKSYRIADDVHVGWLMTLGDTHFAITSFNHMRANEGALIRMDRGQRRDWVTGGTTRLPLAPSAVAPLSPHSVLVVDDQGFYTLDGNSGMNRTHASHWYYTSPSHALVRDDGSIVLSARHVIFTLVPDSRGYLETMMVPPACTEFTLDMQNTDCVCGSAT